MNRAGARRRRALAAVIGALLLSGISPGSPVAHAQPEAEPAETAAAQAATWSLAEDMEAHTQLNPFPDAEGNDGTWGLYAADVDADPATATLLPEYTDGVCSSNVRGWREGGLPLVAVNASDTDAECAPPHTVLAHPSPTRDAVVVWTAPRDTAVTVRGRLTELDSRGGGNGVGYRLLLGTTVLDEGVVTSNTGTDLAVRTVPVTRADRLALVLTARDGNSDYDSTRIDLTLSEAATPSRATLRSTTPRSLRQGAPGTVTLIGTGFDADTRVALDDPTGIALGTPAVHGSRKLVLAVSVDADAAPTTRHWQVFEDGTSRSACAQPTACSLTVLAVPRLDAVDPSQVARGQGADVTLTGRGFAPGMTVRVGGKGVTVGSVVVEDPTTARVHLDATATAPTGRRTVVVLDPGGAKSTLKRALTVTR